MKKRILSNAADTEVPEKTPEKKKKVKPVKKVLKPKQLRETTSSGAHDSVWLKEVQPLFTAKPESALSTDVVIVGGGIAGVTIAFNLVRAGFKVVLLEDGGIGSGETGRTTAHLSAVLDRRYYDLENIHGKRGARLIAESHRRAIDFIELVVQNEHIDCDFERVTGYLFRDPSDEKDVLEKEQDAAGRAGLKCEMIAQAPGLLTKEAPCLAFKQQAQFHPVKYLHGLCRLIEKDGGKIFTNTHAEEIDGAGVKTSEGYNIRAKHVVVATNSPVNNKYMMHLRQVAYRSYVIGARVKKGTLKHALWWDTGDFNEDEETPPYHYVRLHPLEGDDELLICGGEDHRTGEAKSTSEDVRYERLEKWMRKHFPVEEVVVRWSGQVYEPMDALACIGRNPADEKNVYIVTSTSGSGMTYGTIAAMLIPDLIKGVPNKWEKVYDPSRFPLRRAGLFIKETVAGLFGKLKQKKYPKGLSSLEPGHAKIVELDEHPFGAYCDDKNVVHLVNAKCTHLQCTVKWNGDEKSWDCPCHGSRFTFTGKVMNGPANEDLDYHSVPKTGRKPNE